MKFIIIVCSSGQTDHNCKFQTAVSDYLSATNWRMGGGYSCSRHLTNDGSGTSRSAGIMQFLQIEVQHSYLSGA